MNTMPLAQGTPPTLAQRKALEAIRAERVTYFSESDSYYTLGRDFARAQQSVIKRVLMERWAEVVFRGSSREGVLILTDAGRAALEPAQ